MKTGASFHSMVRDGLIPGVGFRSGGFSGCRCPLGGSQLRVKLGDTALRRIDKVLLCPGSQPGRRRLPLPGGPPSRSARESTRGRTFNQS